MFVLEESDSDGGGSVNAARSQVLLNCQKIFPGYYHKFYQLWSQRLRGEEEKPGGKEKGLGLSNEDSCSLFFPGGKRPPVLPHLQVFIGPWLWEALQHSLYRALGREGQQTDQGWGTVCMKQPNDQGLTESPLETVNTAIYHPWSCFLLGPFSLPSIRRQCKMMYHHSW